MVSSGEVPDIEPPILTLGATSRPNRITIGALGIRLCSATIWEMEHSCGQYQRQKAAGDKTDGLFHQFKRMHAKGD